ncbi:BQ5605_C016g08126 [Microbotryum silenes-dioicae]|uniref:BQ5605_C016g08126 protein n=1 Tax=Microbotryum silenes-dioicae TaxID=796604 RepID=A0A2X0NT05_9BASI|nr:BQ5605_C016g08126 [Microbotryum silenes-dioicae]
MLSFLILDRASPWLTRLGYVFFPSFFPPVSRTLQYVVDGNWQFNPNEPHETDASGNVNNVFTAPAAPAVVETPAAAQTEAVVIPLTEVSQQQPVLPVPASINETTSTVDSVAQPTPVAAAVVETPAAAPAATEEPKKMEEKPDLVSAATAGVAAIALGAAGLAGAAIHKVTGSDPVGIDPTPNKNLATKTEVPAEPTHTPTTAPPTTSLPTVPSAATISTAVEKNEHVKTESDVKPVVAVAGVGVAAAAGAETTALATNAGETAGVHTTESSTFQQGEKYLKSFAAKHGKEKELHDIAVKADEYLAQAKAEGSKRFTEGEKMAGDAYEKVAATSFGASTMHALGLDKKASTPSTTTSPAALPKVEAVPDPAAPDNKLLNQTLGSTTAVTDPAAPKVAVAPTPAPATASLSPASPASKSDGYSTAPSTPLKSAPATPSKGQSGVGHGDAPGTPSSTASKTRKPSFLKRLLGGSKSSPKAEE